MWIENIGGGFSIILLLLLISSSFIYAQEIDIIGQVAVSTDALNDPAAVVPNGLLKK